jgi:hypothetical protein
MELEGHKELIDYTATCLGFSASDYVISSYAALWTQYLRGRSNAPANMIFVEDPPVPERKDP